MAHVGHPLPPVYSRTVARHSPSQHRQSHQTGAAPRPMRSPRVGGSLRTGCHSSTARGKCRASDPLTGAFSSPTVRATILRLPGSASASLDGGVRPWVACRRTTAVDRSVRMARASLVWSKGHPPILRGRCHRRVNEAITFVNAVCCEPFATTNPRRGKGPMDDQGVRRRSALLLSTTNPGSVEASEVGRAQGAGHPRSRPTKPLARRTVGRATMARRVRFIRSEAD